MAIPTQDDALLNWSDNADTHLTASPTTYGTTATVASQYHTVHEAYSTALANLIASRSAGTRSEALTSLKESAKLGLLDFARPLYKQIQANTAVLDSDKIALGIRVPDTTPTPTPVPGAAPGVRVVSVDGRLVAIELFDPENPTYKRIPAGIDGAIVMTAVAPTAPTDPSDYKMQGPTSRVGVEILFPDSCAPGTQVWIIAAWFNGRKEMGPACSAVGAIINYGGSMPMVG